MKNKSYNNIPVELLPNVFLTQTHPQGWGTGRIEVDWYILERNRRWPHPFEDGTPCFSCLHVDCRKCSGDYPREEELAEQLGLA